jgi:hypothetical protein
MSIKIIKASALVAALLGLTGCASTGSYVPTQLGKDELKRVETGEIVRLQFVQPDKPTEKLVVKAANFPNGVVVCAIESLSKPCLPKLSALVAEKLAKKGVVIAQGPSQADATVYFEAWFDSFSTSASAIKMMDNPTQMGKDFALKMEQGLSKGVLPDVHKRFKFAGDPISLIALNSNDEQKFVYVALTAVVMKDAVTYPGEGIKQVGASNHPWVKPGLIPAARTLVGNYEGEIATDKAVMPMLNDAIDLLVERVGQMPPFK